MFGRLNQDCRQEITKPFRAKAVRVVSVDYSLTYKDSWSLEFGGMDYMEGIYVWMLCVLRTYFAVVHKFSNIFILYDVPGESEKSLCVWRAVE